MTLRELEISCVARCEAVLVVSAASLICENQTTSPITKPTRIDHVYSAFVLEYYGLVDSQWLRGLDGDYLVIGT